MDNKNLVEQTARVVHEANRALCNLHGDTSQKSWEDAEEWQRKAAIEGVANAMRGVTSEELHERWMDSKKADGWVYGKNKDGAKKTHPDMIPYKELSNYAKSKDLLFNDIVRDFVKAVVESVK